MWVPVYPCGRLSSLERELRISDLEPNDGSHVFEIQLGSPLTDPTGPLPVADAHYLKVGSHAFDLLFETLHLGQLA
ncbi:hypothetical protein V8E55_006696 [Tylopilus felleus]